jgi:hypothetical protein
VMKIMATYGSECPPMRQRIKARRKIASGATFEFEYIEPIANHFDYRHCVDDNNHLRHMRPSIEEIWKTHRWVLRVLAFFLAVSEVNAFLCFRYFVWNKLKGCSLSNLFFFNARVSFERAAEVRDTSR